jgi:hypothetical protein
MGSNCAPSSSTATDRMINASERTKRVFTLVAQDNTH